MSEQCKEKIFAWLYFKDCLSTKENLLHKHVLDDGICCRCSHPVEDRHHVFFSCCLSRELWSCIGLSSLASADNINNRSPPSSALGNDSATWPSILLILLCRLWDARNNTIFRNERHSSACQIISHICDDLAIWEGRFVSVSTIPSSRQWRAFLRSCMETTMIYYLRYVGERLRVQIKLY